MITALKNKKLADAEFSRDMVETILQYFEAYADDEGVLTVHLGDQEVACFPPGSWDGVYKHEGNRVREKDGRERNAQRLEVQLSVGR